MKKKRIKPVSFGSWNEQGNAERILELHDLIFQACHHMSGLQQGAHELEVFERQDMEQDLNYLVKRLHEAIEEVFNGK